jgi:hypothetical protein
MRLSDHSACCGHSSIMSVCFELSLPRCDLQRTACSLVSFSTVTHQLSMGWEAQDCQRWFRCVWCMCVVTPLSCGQLCCVVLGVGAMQYARLAACFNQQSQQRVVPSCTLDGCALSSHNQQPHVCMNCKMHRQNGAAARHTTGAISHILYNDGQLSSALCSG